MLRQRHPEREAARLDRNPVADGVEDQAEHRAVQCVQGEAGSAPMPAARHSLTE